MTLGTASGTVVALVASLLPSAVSAQTHVGKDIAGGLHWHVAAPEDTPWRLVCRFRPITYYQDWAQHHRWANRTTREGRGPQAGRLPGDNGRCTLTRTGGPGALGLAIVKNGVAHAAGTNDAAQVAAVSVF